MGKSSSCRRSLLYEIITEQMHAARVALRRPARRIADTGYHGRLKTGSRFDHTVVVGLVVRAALEQDDVRRVLVFVGTGSCRRRTGSGGRFHFRSVGETAPNSLGADLVVLERPKTTAAVVVVTETGCC